MRHAADTLDRLGVAYETRIVSAHRTPERLYDYAARARRSAGLKVIIAGAGGAAHLPGMAAAMTPLPVLGVPVESQHAARHRQPAVDRPDAGRHPGRDLRDRQSRRRQCRRCSPPRSSPSSDPSRSPALADWRRARRRRPWPSARWQTCAMTGGAVRTAAPGGTIGILGGGQLGRMTALAAAHSATAPTSLSPEPDCPGRAGVRRGDDRAARRRRRARPLRRRGRRRDLRVREHPGRRAAPRRRQAARSCRGPGRSRDRPGPAARERLSSRSIGVADGRVRAPSTARPRWRRRRGPSAGRRC